MSEWRVTLVSQTSDREFAYSIASLTDLTDEQVTFRAIAAHGEMILLGRVDEVVRPQASKITRVR